MANKFDTLASTLVELVGGKDNVSFATHCATRLRLNLKDTSLIKEDVIKATKGVLGTASANGQFQIIIGPDVTELYQSFSKIVGDTNQLSNDVKDEKKGINKFLDTLTGIFTPTLPALTASSFPVSLNSTSVHPVNRFNLFHSLSPCLTNTNFIFSSTVRYN